MLNSEYQCQPIQEPVRFMEVLKHPLQHAWTLWYYEPDRLKNWEANQHLVSTFNTVEDFWSLFSHIKQPSELKSGADYSLFKEGIRPMWEDKANKEGGRWVLSLAQRLRNDLDRYWIDALMCLIGEAFDCFESICGVVVNVRNKGDKIAIWTNDSKNEKIILDVGQKLREGLNLSHPIVISYESHRASMNKSSSNVKSLYEI